ncbi:MAG: carbohydrate ABC transporter permease [Candidatus Heimdallarchaeota archaeon]
MNERDISQATVRNLIKRIAGLVRRIWIHILLLIIGFVVLMPFFWMITTSLKPPALIHVPPHLIPTRFYWQNYVISLETAPFGRYYLNTIIVALGIVIGQLFLSSLAGYAFARLQFPGRNIIFLVLLSTLMIPMYITIIPSYLIIRAFGLLNTYPALILPFLVSAFGIFLFRQYYVAFPKELEDKALMDGCSRLQIWRHIFLPLSKPAFAALGIFSFLFAWNSFLWPLIITTDPNMWTVQIGLAMFSGQYSKQWTYQMAGTTISIIPAIVIFIVLQKYYIKHLALSARLG